MLFLNIRELSYYYAEDLKKDMEIHLECVILFRLSFRIASSFGGSSFQEFRIEPQVCSILYHDESIRSIQRRKYMDFSGYQPFLATAYYSNMHKTSI